MSIWVSWNYSRGFEFQDVLTRAQGSGKRPRLTDHLCLLSKSHDLKLKPWGESTEVKRTRVFTPETCPCCRRPTFQVTLCVMSRPCLHWLSLFIKTLQRWANDVVWVILIMSMCSFISWHILNTMLDSILLWAAALMQCIVRSVHVSRLIDYWL